ncbi:MAG: hypothetical protein IPL32_17190 [Chloracidobacterium sp.]|nr:hypothetical protein [Chloracidobacterium sp.]
MPTPTVSKYWNEEKGYYLVEQYASSPRGGSIALKEPAKIRAEEFDDSIVDAIVNCFERYEKDDFNPNLVSRMSDKEWRQFSNQHKKVILELNLPDHIDIYSMEKYRGGEHTVIRDSKVSVDKNFASEQLPSVIREAFLKAS